MFTILKLVICKFFVAPNNPKVELLDWYGGTIKGDFAQDIDVTANLFGKGLAQLSGATSAPVANDCLCLAIDW